MIQANTTIAQEFKEHDGKRQTRLEASEQYAYYTIPSVFPKLDTSDNQVSVGMADNIGSLVANHMANKLVTTLFSPNRPFFRIVLDDSSKEAKLLEEAENSGDEQVMAQAQQAVDAAADAFAQTEKKAVKYLENIGYRTSATHAAKLLLVTGDVVIRSTKDKKSVVYGMRDYVAWKSMSGQDVGMIVRDAMPFGNLEPDMQASVQAASDKPDRYMPQTDVTIYTKLLLQDDGRYKVTQAVENVDIPEGEEPNLVTSDSSPFTHLSWNWSKGENYGRGLVEDHAGSFHVIDQLTTAQLMLAAKASDIKTFIDPASGIDVEELNSTESGTYISGKLGDVQAQQMGMAQDLQHMEAVIEKHKRQISAAFLYQQGGTRNAERVTAEEIRENAAELEIAHGGVYSRFASDWQQKVAREATAAVGDDMGDVVEPQILTGMDSISRVGEMQAVHMFVNDLAILNNLPEDARSALNIQKYANFAARNRGVETGEFVKTPAELQADQAAAQAEAQAQTDMASEAAMQQEGAKAMAAKM